MTPYERLMAEEIPTGTFGHALPPKPPQRHYTPSWTPDEQAQHLADLLTALNGWESQDHHDVRKRERHRHLRLIQPHHTHPDAA